MSPPLPDPAHPMLHRTFRLQWEDMQQSWVLLYPEGMVTLNDSAAAILQRCDGAHTLDMLIDDLQSAFGVQGIAPEVHAFVKHALERGWLV
ncbi:MULTISPECIES: pyrroloquinoline quinone biosynthesis peptide chaperone PqqD [Ralstonia]|jgi:pyrroloquinoline quinone biosynthesis protein D|uniref:Pyrroloquinoline quinone biosynthesis peptide chaperone PqqD n=2 Tax=Ralstonia TaxID=48736 RepID=A0AAE3I1B7_9RALS|nr:MULTISPECIES: pyrroloquinoline quinone biosynthesis peptide chaperone PqqD [Ralstonia]KJJ94929.1 pyrroloquinoline quinone biosynthesis protein PqqD [Burkholderiaceae bacterium 26]MCO5410613.1 pyrroloquinoline quinone biosynthesis peptide chaperone PqqD [Ralstonia mojiangensis]MCT7295053.1 pyrroloquinoline quinone biosynthesis peptide chaperone PqqD [Ralstonia mojiangensis]MCT7305804.1 pyrroloquinoline quinone biosynthesis peptide chaperone PqqD [Ralstonia wenshanensis]MCT7313324.1 pyrroloqu